MAKLEEGRVVKVFECGPEWMGRKTGGGTEEEMSVDIGG